LLNLLFFVSIGEDLGPAFGDFTSYELFPALSLNVRQSVRINFGQYKFLYPPDEIDGKSFNGLIIALIMKQQQHSTATALSSIANKTALAINNKAITAANNDATTSHMLNSMPINSTNNSTNNSMDRLRTIAISPRGGPQTSTLNAELNNAVKMEDLSAKFEAKDEVVPNSLDVDDNDGDDEEQDNIASIAQQLQQLSTSLFGTSDRVSATSDVNRSSGLIPNQILQQLRDRDTNNANNGSGTRSFPRGDFNREEEEDDDEEDDEDDDEDEDDDDDDSDMERLVVSY
jgi:hypothetical protein